MGWFPFLTFLKLQPVPQKDERFQEGLVSDFHPPGSIQLLRGAGVSAAMGEPTGGSARRGDAPSGKGGICA